MADNSHKHPGQDEPRSYGQTHHDHEPVNLNTAPEEKIAGLPMIGSDRAKIIVQNRPFNSWEDLERIEGIGKGMIDDLKSGNARLE